MLLYRLIVFICSPSRASNQTPTGPNKKQQQQQQSQLAKEQAKQNLILAGYDPRDGIPQGRKLGWMTEAKDWAGELISGQSTTGKILVS